ncbi:MAG TPA: hypothetical protein VFV48_03125 [Pseudomonadales bacterium]|nr:hypothetical protein [Pseudomonadales bacterium]
MNKTEVLSKVPEITLVFWLIKILATTLGETGGDAVSMSLGLGYLVSSMIFGLVFIVAVAIQMFSKQFHPLTYWATIIATTTVGTTLADYADRSLGIGYAGGSAILLSLLLLSLLAWRKLLGSIAIETVNSPKSEAFYWLTIMFSQTLGTALGDWVADTEGLGYAASAAIFSGLLALIALAYYKTNLSRVYLFWGAFILTRPLGAVVGDFLDKPIENGGLELSRYSATAALLFLIAILLIAFKQKPAAQAH